jgi:hypothetical protein
MRQVVTYYREDELVRRDPFLELSGTFMMLEMQTASEIFLIE